MKKAIILFAMLPLLVALAASASEPVGSVASIEGKVTARDQDGLERTLGLGSPVFLGDRIITGPSSKVEIRFVDDSVLGQGEKSEMVINDYVYAPDRPEDNRSFLRLFKGVFRVVTDKITKLNPERFEVKTNYGTIGIRGCELAFDLTADVEQVAVIALHHAESVVVSMAEDVGQDVVVNRARSMDVTEDGILVNLSETEGLTQRPLATAEILNFNLATTPASVGAPAVPTGTGADAGKNSALQVEDAQSSSAGAVEQVSVVAAAKNRASDEQPVAATEPEADTVRSTSSSGSNASPDLPQTGPRELVAAGAGQDWSWSIWQQETSDLVGNTPVSTLTHGNSIRGDQLGSLEFAAIAQGGNVYNLNGSGSAGAVVSQGSEARVLQGVVDMNVRVGLGIVPSWSGDFQLGSSQGDALAFDVDGGVQGGSLTMGNLNAYNLNAFGSTHGSPSGASVGGFLVGPGIADPANPISGGVVEFEFDHGAGGPHVVGAGGADLR